MAKGKGGAVGSVTIKKKGATRGLNPGNESTSKRSAPLAIKGGGATLDPVPRKTRVIGSGEH